MRIFIYQPPNFTSLWVVIVVLSSINFFTDGWFQPLIFYSVFVLVCMEMQKQDRQIYDRVGSIKTSKLITSMTALAKHFVCVYVDLKVLNTLRISNNYLSYSLSVLKTGWFRCVALFHYWVHHFSCRYQGQVENFAYSQVSIL